MGQTSEKCPSCLVAVPAAMPDELPSVSFSGQLYLTFQASVD